MKKFKKHNKDAPIQTGRTLPNRVTSYSPGRDTLPPPVTVEPKPRPSAKKITFRLFAVVLLAVLIAAIVLGIWDARNISAAEKKMFGTGNIMKLLQTSPLKTGAGGRVNVLVAGYSADDPLHQGATLTDSVMLLSMDPSNKTGYMLSIPRDLYVKIPGFGYGKINEAYKDGGMNLLRQIVERDFGVSIGYYALVDYTAVRSIVNAVGGINVTIKSPDGRLYDPNKDWVTDGPLVNLSNGTHHLNGEQALDLTRARGDSNPYGIPVGFEQSDFQRTADQRLVFSAIKDKLNWKLILNPRQNGAILNALAENVKTNLQAGEAKPLFNLFNSIPSAQLESLSLRNLNGKNYLVSTNYEGDTLSPAAGLDDYSVIDAVLAQYNR